MSLLEMTRPRKGRPPLFTREVLEAIPVWLEMGATVPEIAAALDTTERSLRTTCSAYNISLRTTSTTLRGRLTHQQWHAIQHEATRRGVVVWQLVADIVGRVAEDNLFAMVLSKRDQ